MILQLTKQSFSKILQNATSYEIYPPYTMENSFLTISDRNNSHVFNRLIYTRGTFPEHYWLMENLIFRLKYDELHHFHPRHAARSSYHYIPTTGHEFRLASIPLCPCCKDARVSTVLQYSRTAVQVFVLPCGIGGETMTQIIIISDLVRVYSLLLPGTKKASGFLKKPYSDYFFLFPSISG